MRWYMRSCDPPAVYCVGSSDDCTADGLGPSGMGLGVGDGIGIALRISAAPAAAGPLAGGSAVCGGGVLCLGLFELRGLPGRYPHGRHGGHGLGRMDMGNDRGAVATQTHFLGLEGNWMGFWGVFPSNSKNFKNFSENMQKSICICENKGYNRMEYVSGFPADIRRDLI